MNQEPTISDRLNAIRQTTDMGVEYWRARQIMGLLGYSEYRNFVNAIQRSIVAIDVSGEISGNHFVETTKMVELGDGGMRQVPDYFLSRPACYIIAPPPITA